MKKMREIGRINRHHTPAALQLAAREAVGEAIKIAESKNDGADRVEFGPEDTELATVLYLKHADSGVTSRDLRGNRGRRGRLGEAGAPGTMGRQGLQGKQGEQGLEGVQGDTGDKGLEGRQGEVGIEGPVGPRGPKGDTGLAPAHEWEEAKLRFRNPDGSWGRRVNLRGMTGGRGGQGEAGAGGGTTGLIQERFDSQRSLAFFLGT